MISMYRKSACLSACLSLFLILCMAEAGAVIREYKDISQQELVILRQRAALKGMRLDAASDMSRALEYEIPENLTPGLFSPSVPLETSPSWMSAEEYAVGSVRWADMDNDGDLDLVTAHYEGGYPARPEQTRVWFNEGGELETTSSWESTDEVWSTGVALGDLDLNGYPDAAVVNSNGSSNVIYFQDAEGLEQTPSWSSVEDFFSLSVSFGDVTGEGYLDAAIVNQGVYTDPDKPNHLYGNTTGIPPSSASWTSADEAQNMAGALGDYDEDGISQEFFVFSGDGYRNIFRLGYAPLHSILEVTVDSTPVTAYCVHLREAWIVFQSPPPAGTDNVSVEAEVSQDLDFAVSVDHGNAKVYHDTGTTLESIPSFTVSGAGDRREKGVSWADVDGDGDLDLFVGGRDVPSMLYENIDGVLNTEACWASDDSEPSCSDLDWIDMDNDGDLDLAVGSTGDSNYDLVWVHENIDGTLETDPSWVIPWSAVSSMCNTVAWGDMNGDGFPDLAAGFAGSHIRVYLNTGVMPDTPTPTSIPDTPTPWPTETPSSFPTHTPTDMPTASPTNIPTAVTPSFTPTLLPTNVPTLTPNPTLLPTETPVCSVLGVTIWMPDDDFQTGENCELKVTVCNPDDAGYGTKPLFVILDVFGEYLFAPGFGSDVDFYSVEIAPGQQELQVIEPFNWPPNAGTADGMMFYAAMTDQNITMLFGEMDQWTFGWSDD